MPDADATVHRAKVTVLSKIAPSVKILGADPNSVFPVQCFEPRTSQAWVLEH